MATIPHEDIRRIQDRSWSLRLLALFVTTSGGERAEIAETLARLDDPRCEGPLTAILEDQGQPADLRDDAGAILRYSGNPAAGSRLRAWWAAGDRVLQRHALLSMGRAEGDLVTPVVDDPSHPLHRDAIATMMFGFEEPHYQASKVRALGHDDPFVREAAADVLLWDEPAMAENSLVVCARDPDVDVAIAAIKTLRYYATRRCVKALGALRDHENERVRAEANESFAEVCWRFRDELGRLASDERSRLWAWMTPVRELLAFTLAEVDAALPHPSPPNAHAASHDPGCGCHDASPNDTSPNDTSQGSGSPNGTSAGTAETTGSAGDAENARGGVVRERAKLAETDAERNAFFLSTDELFAIYGAADGAWAEKLESFPGERDAARYRADRERLVPFLLAHPDGGVRERACALLASWGDREGLVSLLRDPRFVVRKSAMYWMSKLAPDATLAPLIWAHLEAPDTSSTHAYETLLTYVVHAPRDEMIPRLVALVENDGREAVRYHATYALAKLEARDEIVRLFVLLDEPPRVTWGVHLALLDAARKLSIPLKLPAHLRDVDQLDVQAELAR